MHCFFKRNSCNSFLKQCCFQLIFRKMSLNFATTTLVLTILEMVTSSNDSLVSPEVSFRDVELVRAYFRLIQNTRTYRLFKLEHMCVINVKIFDQKVRNHNLLYFY